MTKVIKRAPRIPESMRREDLLSYMNRDYTSRHRLTIGFIKKDGTLRTMKCTTANMGGLKGLGARYDLGAKGYKCVYDLEKEEYRTVNTNTIQTFEVDGKKVEVV